MRQKLNRSQPSMFDKRKGHPLKILIRVFLCLAVVAAGFFSAKWITEGQRPSNNGKPAIQADVETSPSSDAVPDTPSDDSGTITPEDTVPTPDALASLDRIRAFYLPLSALSVDSAETVTLLSEARQTGFNAVIFDLKDAEGNLYYRFTAPTAQRVNTYDANALTGEQLSALFDLIRGCGLHPIPRLYAFRDNAACGVLTDARISYADNHSWAWYDGVREKGAKKWLNPYSEVAQSYIRELVCELQAQGAPAIMLEGVQFPDRLDKSAYLGTAAASVSKSDVLTTFVADTRTALGEDFPLLLSCTAESALGTETKVYGGNPLTFAPTFASPSLTSNVEEAVGKMVRRIQVLEDCPTLAPILPTDGLPPEAVNEAIAACIGGGADSFIVYHPKGSYDFTSYTLP